MVEKPYNEHPAEEEPDLPIRHGYRQWDVLNAIQHLLDLPYAVIGSECLPHDVPSRPEDGGPKAAAQILHAVWCEYENTDNHGKEREADKP